MDEAFIKKVQPNSPEAEKSVIGSMLMDRDAIIEVADVLVKEETHQQLYSEYWNFIKRGSRSTLSHSRIS